MKLIENKKLFGKINFFDIFLVLVIIAGGLFAYKYLYKGNSSSFNIGSQYVKVNYVIRMENLPLGIEKYIVKGTSVYDNETNVYMGKVVSFYSGDFVTTRESDETESIVSAKVPDRQSIYMTAEVEVSDQGADLITANNYFIKVGKHIGIRAGRFAGDGYIVTIDRLDNKTYECTEPEGC